tara:strand:+ start:178 stop:501 length:324 start_codon:yes stop_codon:yes gene_type:complete
MPVLGTQVIKSIQRGSTSLASTGTSSAITINAVDLDKTFVSASCRNGYRGARYSATSSDPWTMNATTAGAQLTSTTAITIYGGLGYAMSSYIAAYNVTLYWEVIEYV